MSIALLHLHLIDWGLRDFGIEGQIGWEKTVDDFLQNLLQVFDEVKRVLKKCGTCWVNMGTKIQDKCDLMIPERFVISMVNHGWIKKRTKIWWKPNAFNRSLEDDMNLDFEYLYFFTKSQKYYFKQQFEPTVGLDLGNGTIQYPYRKMYTGRHKRGYENKEAKDSGANSWTPKERHYNPKGRNKRAVWRIATKGSQWEYCKHCDTFYHSRKSIKKREVIDGKTVKYCNNCNATDGWVGHFASFPEALVETPVLAGCPEGGIVLDPFIGSGTTAIVAKKLGRQYIGIDINQLYVDIAEKRLKETIYQSERLWNQTEVASTMIKRRSDAKEYAALANLKRRKPLTKVERRKAIERMLKLHPERSNSWIAEDMGVSKNTVGKYREELETGCQIDRLNKFIGRDGKEYPREIKQPKQKDSK